MKFNDRVYRAVTCVPKGKVVSYGMIASMVGSPRASRQVGWALHANPYFGTVPCHRIVFKDGGLAKGFAFGGEEIQRELLESEGVTFTAEGKVEPSCFATAEELRLVLPAEETEEP